MTGPHGIIVADPNALMRQSLAELVDRDRRFRLIATARNADGLLETCQRVPIDVALVNWALPQIGAERLLQVLQDIAKPPRIIVYAVPDDPDLPQRALAAGAAGFCTADTQPQDLLDVAMTVANGRMVFPIMDVRSIVKDPKDALTARETTIIAALASGRTNQELASELKISVYTVKFHLRNLYSKLGLKNRSQAIAFFYSKKV